MVRSHKSNICFFARHWPVATHWHKIFTNNNAVELVMPFNPTSHICLPLNHPTHYTVCSIHCTRSPVTRRFYLASVARAIFDNISIISTLVTFSSLVTYWAGPLWPSLVIVIPAVAVNERRPGFMLYLCILFLLGQEMPRSDCFTLFNISSADAPCFATVF